MDAERFDLLLRSFAAVASRRHAVRFLASAALDGLLSLRPSRPRRQEGRQGKDNNKKAPIEPGERCRTKKQGKLGKCVEGAVCN